MKGMHSYGPTYEGKKFKAAVKNVGNKPHPFLTEKDFAKPGQMFGPKSGRKSGH